MNVFKPRPYPRVGDHLSCRFKLNESASSYAIFIFDKICPSGRFHTLATRPNAATGSMIRGARSGNARQSSLAILPLSEARVIVSMTIGNLSLG